MQDREWKIWTQDGFTELAGIHEIAILRNGLGLRQYEAAEAQAGRTIKKEASGLHPGGTDLLQLALPAGKIGALGALQIEK